MLAAALLAATGLTISFTVKLAEAPEQMQVLLLAPRSRARAVGIALFPSLLASAVPFAVLVLPLALYLFRASPRLASQLMLEGAISFAWSAVFTCLVVVLTTRLLGRERGLHSARGLGTCFAVGGMMALRWLIAHAPGGGAWTFVLASALLLPLILWFAGPAFLDLLMLGDPASSAAEPTWGNPGHWRRLLRTPAPLLLAGAVPAIVLALVGSRQLRALPIGLMAMFITAAAALY